MFINCHGVEIRQIVHNPSRQQAITQLPMPPPDSKHNGNKYKNQLRLASERGRAQHRNTEWRGTEQGVGVHLELYSTLKQWPFGSEEKNKLMLQL